MAKRLRQVQACADDAAAGDGQVPLSPRAMALQDERAFADANNATYFGGAAQDCAGPFRDCSDESPGDTDSSGELTLPRVQHRANGRHSHGFLRRHVIKQAAAVADTTADLKRPAHWAAAAAAAERRDSTNGAQRPTSAEPMIGSSLPSGANATGASAADCTAAAAANGTATAPHHTAGRDALDAMAAADAPSLGNEAGRDGMCNDAPAQPVTHQTAAAAAAGAAAGAAPVADPGNGHAQLVSPPSLLAQQQQPPPVIDLASMNARLAANLADCPPIRGDSDSDDESDCSEDSGPAPIARPAKIRRIDVGMSTTHDAAYVMAADDDEGTSTRHMQSDGSPGPDALSGSVAGGSQSCPVPLQILAQRGPVEVQVFEGYWGLEDVRTRRDALFVYGDNDTRCGNAGQAVVRGEANSIGLATKRLPCHVAQAYYRDEDFEANAAKISAGITRIAEALVAGRPATNAAPAGPFKTLVVPRDGFGTGRARLDTDAPRTFAFLKQQVNSFLEALQPNSSEEVDW